MGVLTGTWSPQGHMGSPVRFPCPSADGVPSGAHTRSCSQLAGCPFLHTCRVGPICRQSQGNKAKTSLGRGVRAGTPSSRGEPGVQAREQPSLRTPCGSGGAGGDRLDAGLALPTRSRGACARAAGGARRREVPEVRETKSRAAGVGRAGRARRGPRAPGSAGSRRGPGPRPGGPGRSYVPTAWPGASRCPFREAGRPARVRRVN